MTKDEFRKWYREHIEIMALMGVFHPDSPSGKTVHLSIASVSPMISRLDARLKKIEEKLEIVGEEIDLVEAPLIEPPKTEKKVAAPKKRAAPVKKKKEPAKSGWQI
jgi:hypothetical protein